MSLISIASSGIGGSNGHCILQAPPQETAASPELAEGLVLLALGGLSPRAALAISDDVSNLVTSNTKYLRQLSNVYGRRARQMAWRSYALLDTQAGILKPKFSEPSLVQRGSKVVGFVFSGQGPQHLQSK